MLRASQQCVMERARAFMQCLQGAAIINDDIGALDAALPV
tara:strand:- start:1 stop:120 length:120 start_codon:yes stop_codon:yes gene_type:complete